MLNTDIATQDALLLSSLASMKKPQRQVAEQCEVFIFSICDSRNKTSTVSYGTAFLFFQRGKGWEKDNPEKRNTLPLIMYHIALLDFSIQRGYLFTPLRLKRFL